MLPDLHPLDHPHPDEVPPSDGRRLRGERSRRSVLDHAVQAASVDGLDGLTFGSLALGTGTGKSAVAGLFGTKEQLQLATVAHARGVFLETVIVPARAAGPGLARVWDLVRRWSDYSRERTFAGGCFFRVAEAEISSRPGAVRDAVAAVRREWEAYLAHHVGTAVTRGELGPNTDASQVVFEIGALLGAANDRSVLLGDDGAYAVAQDAVRATLVARGADRSLLA